MARYSGVSGALLASSQRGAAVRFHWPLRSGYLVSSNAWATPSVPASAISAQIELRSMIPSRLFQAPLGPAAADCFAVTPAGSPRWQAQGSVSLGMGPASHDDTRAKIAQARRRDSGPAAMVCRTGITAGGALASSTLVLRPTDVVRPNMR